MSGNREAAELVGIPTTQRAGHRLRPRRRACLRLRHADRARCFPFTVLSGDAYQLKSFVVTVLGGLGNPAGALLAASRSV